MKTLLIFLTGIIIIGCKQTNTGSMENLPKPEMKGGKPIMLALRDRCTTRGFDTTNLELQTISNLLWAANGINRPETGKRTAPSAMNKQEIDIYLASQSGVYFFNFKENNLKKLLDKDVRSIVGHQEFVKDAPICLFFIADYSRTDVKDTVDRRSLASINTGYISQNVYLFCASENLATVAVGWMKKDTLTKALQLRANQDIILAQPVGYFKKD